MILPQSIRGDELSKVAHENQQLKATLHRLEVQQLQLQDKLGHHERSDDLLEGLGKDLMRL